MTLSAGVGHVAGDVLYAEKDLIDAVKAVADAKKELNHIETLHKNGQAESEAVEDAKINLAMASINLTLADLKVAAAAAKAAETSVALGFYADLTLTKTGQKTNSNTNNTQEIASNILAKNNIVINSGSNLTTNDPLLTNGQSDNTNIKGTLTSTAGDINITSKNDTNITALKSTSNSSTVSKGYSQTITLASTAAASTQIFEKLIQNLSTSIGAGTNRSKSDSSLN